MLEPCDKLFWIYRGFSFWFFAVRHVRWRALNCIFIATVREEKIAWSYESVLYVHLNSLGVLKCRNLVLLAGGLKSDHFMVQISLLFMSPRSTSNSPWIHSSSCGFGEECMLGRGGRWVWSEEMACNLPHLETFACALFWPGSPWPLQFPEPHCRMQTIIIPIT